MTSIKACCALYSGAMISAQFQGNHNHPAGSRAQRLIVSLPAPSTLHGS
jgi:hypothetical protein